LTYLPKFRKVCSGWRGGCRTCQNFQIIFLGERFIKSLAMDFLGGKMRTIFMCILIFISFVTSAFSQPLLEENFDYALGALTVVTTNWTDPGKYLYRLKQMDTGGNFEYSQITEAEYNPPLAYGLEQNYPNPFNPSTKISFAVPKTSFVSVKIYNVLGNQAAVLFNGTASAGKTYDLLFDGSSLASGVYYCVLEDGEKTEVKKMILLG
jgi:hypothetical protein